MRTAPNLLLFIALILPMTAQARAPEHADKTLSPYFVVKGGDSDVDSMPLLGTRADVRISGVIARVKVTQTYKNDGEKPLEAIYVFPGSTRSAVFGMKMQIGKRTIKATIQKREEARKIYEAAKAQGKSASLLEQQRPNVFQMNVANIMPGDVIEVELEYTELLEQEAGQYEFVYPAVVGPRYTEATAKTAGSHDKFTQTPYRRKGSKIPYSWDMALSLNAGVPVKKVSSPSHRIDTRLRGPEATVHLADGERAGDSDFVLRYSLRGEAVNTGLLLYDGDEGEKFFLTMVQPPKAVDDVAMPPREYVFIVDVSGSMHGFPLDTAKSLMRELFTGLRSQDRFNVMMFSGGSRVLSEASVPATQSNLTRALSVIGGQQGGGGTRILPALQRALAMPAAGDMARTFVVITDGYVSVEPEVFDLVRRSLDDANLFAFGIGTSVNRHLVDGMARVGMGEPFVALNATEATKMARRFKKYIESPALTNIKVSFDGFDAYDVEPKAVPDLFAERPVVVFGKYRGAAKGQVVVSGVTGHGNWKKAIAVGDARASAKNEALRYLWARHKIRRLADLDKLRANDKRKEMVTQLGLKYSLMTAYTSFVAVDDAVRNEDGKSTTVKQPLPLPKGVSDRAVGVGGMGLRSSGRGGGGRAKFYRMPRKMSPRVSKPRPMTRPAPEPEPVAEEDQEKAEAEKPRETSRAFRVKGALTAAQIARVLPKLKRFLKACTAGSGAVRITMIVDASGRILKLTPASGPSLSCRPAAMKRFRFPASSGTTMVTFTVTL